MQNIKWGRLQEGHERQRGAELRDEAPGCCSCPDQLPYGCSWWLRRKDEGSPGAEGAWKPGKEWDVPRMHVPSGTPRDSPSRQTSHAGPLVLAALGGEERFSLAGTVKRSSAIHRGLTQPLVPAFPPASPPALPLGPGQLPRGLGHSGGRCVGDGASREPERSPL